jgi:hypothetical protein
MMEVNIFLSASVSTDNWSSASCVEWADYDSERTI